MLMNHLRPAAALILATALLTVLPTVPADAQSTRELRQENERLRAQVRDLEEQLNAARQQIEQLQEQLKKMQETLDRLRTNGSAGEPAEPPAEPEYSVDLNSPEFSPLGLFHTLEKSYNEALGEMELGEPDTRTRAMYMRALQRWHADVNRNLRQRVTWHVRVLDSSGNRRSPTLRLHAIDPKTHEAIGRPFNIDLQRRHIGTIRKIESRHGLDHVVMDAVLTPRVRINERRVEPGPFDNPRLIGPFAEFDFIITPSTFLSAQEAAEREQDTDNPDTGNPTDEAETTRDRKDRSERN